MRNKERTHHRLARLAERQHGIVSIRQLEGLGYSRPMVSRAMNAGRLHRVHRGVYAVGHTCLSPHGRCLAAVLACAPGALASHLTAAWLWGVVTRQPATVDVTAASRRHAKPAMHLHYARLVEDDRAVRAGVPVTALPRTLLDLAAVLSPDRLESAIDRAEALGLFDLRQVGALLDRAGGHPGAGRLRRALRIYRSDPAFTRSRLELRFLELVRKSGLPEPSTNYCVGGYELDAYWEHERFAVELDVYETHGSRRAFERDRLRQEELKLLGIEMIRVTGHRLDREPDAVTDRLVVLLRQRRRDLDAQSVRIGSIRSAG
jgi:very-short-patch-repair endonuclease